MSDYTRSGKLFGPLIPGPSTPAQSASAQDDRGGESGETFAGTPCKCPSPAMNRKPTSVALPVPLLAWLDEEAAAHGMTRNSFVVFQLQLSKQTRHMERIRALEHRMSELERKLVNGV